MRRVFLAHHLYSPIWASGNFKFETPQNPTKNRKNEKTCARNWLNSRHSIGIHPLSRHSSNWALQVRSSASAAKPAARFKQMCSDPSRRVDAGCLNIVTSKVASMVFRTCVLFLLITAAVPVIAQNEAQEKGEAPKLETPNDKASYAIGYNIGKEILNKELDPNPAALVAGITAALAGEKSVLSPTEIDAAFKAMKSEMQEKALAKSASNLKDGKAFLEANKAKDGVKVTKSGLQYIVLKEGSGAKPTRESTVSTHYRGKLIDGTVFDNSYEGDEPTEADKPASFGVTQVIKGWTEALQLMKVGAKYRLFLPSELAYGENGPPGIGPNSVLVFDIELVASEDGQADNGDK